MSETEKVIRRLDTWEKRRKLLASFQEALLERFPEEDYNVFVFGSYVRNDFRDGESDIDLIVYCESRIRQMELEEFCRSFFVRAELEADVLPYYYTEDAYVYAVGILNSVHLTDYYPKKLRNELYIIAGNYAKHKKENAIRKKYQNWEYALRRRYLMRKEGGTYGKASR